MTKHPSIYRTRICPHRAGDDERSASPALSSACIWRLALLFTVGHSTPHRRRVDRAARRARTAELVDVRRFPGSRRHPQFSREALAASLAEAGIGYRHEPDLGGRFSQRGLAPATQFSAPGPARG